MADETVTTTRELWLQGVYSKINWTQIVAAFAMILAAGSGGKLGLDATQQTGLVLIIGVLFNFVTWILRTFFSPAITPMVTTTVTTVTPNPKSDK